MTIKELMDILSKYPKTTKVVMSSDSEGNGISQLDGFCVGKYTGIDNFVAIEQDEVPNSICLFPEV